MFVTSREHEPLIHELTAGSRTGRMAEMARSVVLKPQPRCDRCRLPPRWCICTGFRTVNCPLQVDVLMHPREQWRPSSTGHVIHRTLMGSRRHLWQRDGGFNPATVRMSGRELWVLHPAGERMPVGVLPEQVHVMLIDGAWREATTMAREMGEGGRRISLPMAGESRYWLRTQQDGGRFSTVEALLFLLDAFGLEEARRELNLQFELHVYAGLRARGNKEIARAFLETSPLRQAMPGLLAQLDVRRPR